MVLLSFLEKIKITFIDLRPQRKFRANVEILEGTSIITLENGLVEELSRTPRSTTLLIENKIYPVIHGVDSTLYRKKRRYGNFEAIALPFLLVYAVLSTWMNFQLLFSPALYFDISTLFLLIANLGLAGWVSYIMLTSYTVEIRIKKHLFAYHIIEDEVTTIPSRIERKEVKAPMDTEKKAAVFLSTLMMTLGFSAWFVPYDMFQLPAEIIYWASIGSIIFGMVFLVIFMILVLVKRTDRIVAYAPNLLLEKKDGSIEVVDAYTDVYENSEKDFELLLQVFEKTSTENQDVEKIEELTPEALEQIKDIAMKDLDSGNFAQRKVSDVITELKTQLKYFFGIIVLLVHQNQVKDAEILADKKALKIARDLLEYKALESKSLSEIDRNEKITQQWWFWAIIIAVIVLFAIYAFLWYNDIQIRQEL